MCMKMFLRDSSVVKSTYCSYWGPEFKSQHPHPQKYQGNLILLASKGTCIHVYIAPTHPLHVIEIIINPWHIVPAPLSYWRKGEVASYGLNWGVWLCSVAMQGIQTKAYIIPLTRLFQKYKALLMGSDFVCLSIDAKTPSSLMSDILEPSTYLPGLTASNSITKTTGHLCVSFLYQHRLDTAIIPKYWMPLRTLWRNFGKVCIFAQTVF